MSMRWKNFFYEMVDGGVVITDYEQGAEDVLCIPPQIAGYPVVEIGEEAFSENGLLLTKIEVPFSVRRIGRGAFKMCLNLTELVLHDGLESIGAEALYLTPLTEVLLPDTVREIEEPWEMSSIRLSVSPGNLSFFTDGFCLYQKRGAEQELLVACQQEERAEYCVADGTTVIGESAFAGNEYLKCIVLPGTVQEIRQSAFEGCRGLERIEIPEVNLSEAGLKKGKPKYLSADNSFTGYEGSVPEKKSCVCGLHSIGENAFSHCICLKEIHLPATLETLGRFALSDTYGWSETLIGLERITVSNANTHFMADEDALFEIGNGRDRYLVKYFGRGSTYQIPEDVTRILAGAFRRARFRKCWVPKSVWDVGEDAFRECSALEEVELEESGLRLYVPRQPVYRKDEIMELFYSAERETRLESARKNRMEEKHGSGRWSILDFPEKWKDFAAFYPKQERKVWHSSERYVYDYQGYDALFPTYLSLPEKCGIACCRLRCPVQLAEPSAAEYRKFIAENLTGILHEISKTQDISRLADLAELGFFTGDNIGDCLEVFAQSGSAKCTGFLLGYQREHHLGEDAFDFSL